MRRSNASATNAAMTPMPRARAEIGKVWVVVVKSPSTSHVSVRSRVLERVFSFGFNVWLESFTFFLVRPFQLASFFR
jgi:hypothetical protein